MIAAQVELDGQQVTLEILDTAGQEEFKAFRDASLRQGEGYMLVYSIDDKASFDDVKSTYTFVTRGNEGRPFRVLVIGNKSVRLHGIRARHHRRRQDLEAERKVSTQEAAAWAAQNKITHLETSAKVGVCAAATRRSQRCRQTRTLHRRSRR